MKKIYLLLLIALLSRFATAQTLYFPPNTGTTWDTLSPNTLGYCSDRIDSLYQYLDQTNSKAFILLKDGKIVLERYFDNFAPDSVWYWASAGKSLTAVLVGIAQQEGHLSIEDTTSQYLGAGWTATTPAQEQAITIRNQLSMNSGLDDGVTQSDCTLDTCLLYLAAAGTRWAYHNAPYTLLDQVIAQATGRSINTYLFQKIKQTTGMKGAYLPIGYNNVYFSDARSMARFGLLALNRGTWDGTPVLSDTAYFRQMTTPSQALNEAYGYLWWLNGQSTYQLPQVPLTINGSIVPNGPSDLIMALGKNGQNINVVPSQNLVWIRMGNDNGNTPVPNFYNDSIWIKINELTCSPIATQSLQEAIQTRLFPNPTNSRIHLQSALPIQHWQLYNSLGQLVQQKEVAQQNDLQINIAQQPQGAYHLRIQYINGQSSVHQVLKH